ncbi:MAG: acyltransferase family protein [Methylocella sp.]
MPTRSLSPRRRRERRGLPFGYLGVDVFFAISGYVITRSIMTRADEGRFTINDFFVRRLKRLFPALALVTITTALVER